MQVAWLFYLLDRFEFKPRNLSIASNSIIFRERENPFTTNKYKLHKTKMNN